MEINILNKQIYNNAFIAGGEYSECIKEPSWKPSIDENNIEEWSEDDGIYVPATPLGYRNYTESRIEGVRNILKTEPIIDLSYDDAHNIKKNEEPFKLYDHIIINKVDYVVCGNDDENYYIVTEDNHLYCCSYVKNEV